MASNWWWLASHQYSHQSPKCQMTWIQISGCGHVAISPPSPPRAPPTQAWSLLQSMLMIVVGVTSILGFARPANKPSFLLLLLLLLHLARLLPFYIDILIYLYWSIDLLILILREFGIERKWNIIGAQLEGSDIKQSLIMLWFWFSDNS